jgi:hypothetical protein
MFTQVNKFLIKLLGGYHKDEVLQEIVKDLYTTIGADDILKEIQGVWFVGDKPLQEEEKKLIIAEAQIFINTKLWKILQLDVKYRANLKMFEQSKTETDLIAGKLWLFTLDCFKTRIKSLSKGKGTFN